MRPQPAFFLVLASLVQAEATTPLSIPVGPNPESVIRGFGGDLFVTLMGKTRKDEDGNGRVVRVAGESVSVFSDGQLVMLPTLTPL